MLAIFTVSNRAPMEESRTYETLKPIAKLRELVSRVWLTVIVEPLYVGQ